jgi:hypothetical protein
MKGPLSRGRGALLAVRFFATANRRAEKLAYELCRVQFSTVGAQFAEIPRGPEGSRQEPGARNFLQWEGIRRSLDWHSPASATAATPGRSFQVRAYHKWWPNFYKKVFGKWGVGSGEWGMGNGGRFGLATDANLGTYA